MSTAEVPRPGRARGRVPTGVSASVVAAALFVAAVVATVYTTLLGDPLGTVNVLVMSTAIFTVLFILLELRENGARRGAVWRRVVGLSVAVIGLAGGVYGWTLFAGDPAQPMSVLLFLAAPLVIFGWALSRGLLDVR